MADVTRGNKLGQLSAQLRRDHRDLATGLTQQIHPTCRNNATANH